MTRSHCPEFKESWPKLHPRQGKNMKKTLQSRHPLAPHVLHKTPACTPGVLAVIASARGLKTSFPSSFSCKDGSKMAGRASQMLVFQRYDYEVSDPSTKLHRADPHACFSLANAQIPWPLHVISCDHKSSRKRPEPNVEGCHPASQRGRSICVLMISQMKSTQTARKSPSSQPIGILINYILANLESDLHIMLCIH